MRPNNPKPNNAAIIQTLGPHLFPYVYAYNYQLKFKFLTLNLELIQWFFHRNLFFSLTFRLLRTHIQNFIHKLIFVCKYVLSFIPGLFSLPISPPPESADRQGVERFSTPPTIFSPPNRWLLASRYDDRRCSNSLAAASRRRGLCSMRRRSTSSSLPRGWSGSRFSQSRLDSACLCHQGLREALGF